MSGSDTDRSQHELSYYTKDKVKLMKETLKIIKPKRIKTMAPDCIKHLNIAEINSMLLEELLGISNKRLTYIFNGEDVERETSSSDSEDNKIDIISLDDISDDDNFELNSANSKQNTFEESSKKNKSNKRKSERGDTVKVKKERTKKSSSTNTKRDMGNESEKSKLMSVLELLELQARARAIRSQLAIEAENGKNSKGGDKIIDVKQEDSDSDAVIINSPSHNEIIITSESDLEHDEVKKSSIKILSTEGSESASHKDTQSEIKQKKDKLLSKLQKIKLIRHKHTSIESNVNENVHTPNTNTESSLSTDQNEDKPKTDLDRTNVAHYDEVKIASEKDMNCDNDEIVINLDEDELESMDNV